MEKSNLDIAIFLRRIADMLEIQGENQFKVRAYRTASATVEDLQSGLADMAAENGVPALQGLPGIGKSLATQIAEALETGTSSVFERLRREVPETVTEVLAVRGIGMRMASTLYRDFDVVDLEDLARFAEGGGFEAIPGLGDKTIDKLVAGVRAAVKAQPRVALDEATRVAERLAGELSAARPDATITIAGEVRRLRPEVASLDLVAVADSDAQAAVEAFASLPAISRPLVLAPDRAEVETESGLRATLRVGNAAERWGALVRATGSPRHVRQLEERAREVGIAFDDNRLTRDGVEVPLASEQDLYAALELPYIAPEQREGTGEVEPVRA